MRELIEEWVHNDLSVVDPDIGYAPCPFAKKALIDDRLRVVECVSRQDLWETVAVQCKNFSNKHSVIICLEEEPSQTYEEVEAACIAMNEWFACNKLDLWLLSFQTDFTMVFIQRLSELDDASKILEKTGYYENYSKEDYLNLILTRRRRRENGRC
tara:strand:- start:849 stop:1316 length:468 start_codon:yes stop_codon:yes gene_type:complete